MGRETRGLFLVILGLMVAVNAEVLCSYTGPDVSGDLLRLTNFSVIGPLNLKEGDTITVRFNLQNYGQADRKLGTKGVFAAARDPANLDASFGFSYPGTTIKVGQTLSFEGSKVLDKSGTWGVWPSYHISEKEEKSAPDEWHLCKLTVVAATKDSDQDGVTDEKDNCPNKSNKDQKDSDKDLFGDACDNCPTIYNPDQKDSNNNNIGDACEVKDSDKDGIPDEKDNCPKIYNPDQKNGDGDSLGDACDDSDQDGVTDDKDNCIFVQNPKQEDVDKDGSGDACDTCDDRDDDLDGIMNCRDKCPKEKETFNRYQDEDGCPDELLAPVVEIKRTPIVEVKRMVTVNVQTPGGVQPRGINTPTRDRVVGGPIDEGGFEDGDGDGVINLEDECPATPAGEYVFENGCRCTDSDGGIKSYTRGLLRYRTEDNRTIYNDDQCITPTSLTHVPRPQLQERYCNPDYETGESRDASLSRMIDCAFGCEAGKCKRSYTCSSPTGSCADGIQNQGETGIDCGGICAPCNTRCTTGTRYAPADTPCTSNYPTDPHRVNYTWTDSNLELACQYYEVCHPGLDFVIEEALDCCSSSTEDEINLTVDPELCMDAITNSGGNCKKCTGLYIIRGLGTYARWMRGYNWLYRSAGSCGDCVGGCVNGACAYAGIESTPAEMLINDFRTGVCRDYGLAVATLLRKAGYSQHEIGNFCDGAHCYNVVKLPGDTKWHVVDTTGNSHDITIGDLPGTYPYCEKLDESHSCFRVNEPGHLFDHYYTGPIRDVDEYWRIVESGEHYEYPDTGCRSPAIQSEFLPQGGPGVVSGRDSFRVPDFAPALNQIVGCS